MQEIGLGIKRSVMEKAHKWAVSKLRFNEILH